MKIDINLIIKELYENNFYQGRMISGSKSLYRKMNPYNKVVFNANLFIFNNGNYEKIWYGDLDITKDGYILKEIAFNNDVIFYILHEMDGRFENENTQQVIKKSIFNTTEDLEIIDDVFIANRKKEEKEQKAIDKIMKKKYELKINNENKLYEIKEISTIFDSNIAKTYIIDKDNMEDFFKIKYKEIIKLLKSKKYDLYEKQKIIKENSRLSYDFLDLELVKFLNLESKKDLKYTNYWGNVETFKLFEQYDCLFENEIIKFYNKLLKTKEDKKEYTIKTYKPKEIIHYYLCKIDKRVANNEKVNYKSYKDNIIYILERN